MLMKNMPLVTRSGSTLFQRGVLMMNTLPCSGFNPAFYRIKDNTGTLCRHNLTACSVGEFSSALLPSNNSLTSLFTCLCFKVFHFFCQMCQGFLTKGVACYGSIIRPLTHRSLPKLPESISIHRGTQEETNAV